MKTRLIFVRHAEAEGNVGRVFHGWTDSGLTDKGHIQGERLGERMRDIPVDVIYSSSLKRTMQTAEYIAKAKTLPIIRTDKLKEINGGDWEDRPWEELPTKWPEAYDTWEHKPHLHKMPNGETMDEFLDRLLSEVKYIIDGNEGKNVCIVTHGTAIRVMMCYFMGCSREELNSVDWYDNTAVTIMDYEDGNYSIILKGDTCHLDATCTTIENQDWWKEYKRTLEEMKGDKD